MSTEHLSKTLKVTALERARDILALYGRGPVDLGCTEVLNDMLEELANSPQADGMVLVPIEPTKEMVNAGDNKAVIHNVYGHDFYIENTDEVYKAMLSAYKPQEDDVRKDAWISVDDRLPNHHDSVLAFRQHDEWITVCDYVFNKFTIIDSNDELVEAHAITHWQPLPAPPLDKARE